MRSVEWVNICMLIKTKASLTTAMRHLIFPSDENPLSIWQIDRKDDQTVALRNQNQQVL